MNKNILYGITFLFTCISYLYATDKSGNIQVNETWTVSGSPYYITAGVTIKTGYSVNINPGVEVRFATGTWLVVEGPDAKLIANGTANNPIIFTSSKTVPSPGDWKFIKFNNVNNTDSILSHCQISYGGYEDGSESNLGSIYVYTYDKTGYPTIANSTISYSGSNGIVLKTYYTTAFSVTPTISSNTFTNNVYPIYLTNHPSGSQLRQFPVYYNNTFTNNTNNAVAIGNPNSQLSIQYSGTWRNPGCPCVMTGDILVSNNFTLTIDSGTIIKVATGKYLRVEGTLIADGTPEDKITFTSNATTPAPGDWDRIYFYNISNSNSILDNCIIEYGGSNTSKYGELDFDYPTTTNNNYATITNCTIRYSLNYGLCLRAYYGGSGTINHIISSNTFTNNTYPIYYIGTVRHYPVYVNNIFTGNTNNGIGIADNTGLYASGTWWNTGYPYIVSDLTVNSGITLTLEPGVTVKMQPLTTFTVNGTLIARGTADKRITFTSVSDTPQAGDWDHIYIYNQTNNNTVLDYCDVLYGGGANLANVYCNVDDSAKNFYPTISNSIIKYGSKHGIYLRTNSGITNYTPLISSNTISNNGEFPVAIYNNVFPVLTNNTFTNNKYDLLGILNGSNLNASGTLRKHTYPYLVETSLTVIAGYTLTIDPGVTVKFNTSGYLNVQGTLIAQGTSADRITFTSIKSSPLRGDWYYIKFNDSASSSSILEHCEILYGGGASGEGMVHIYNNTQAGVPKIYNCNISSSASAGIYCYNYGTLGQIFQPEISTCTFAGNNYPINITAGTYTNMGVKHFPVYTNLTFTNNSYNGVGFSSFIGRTGVTLRNPGYPYIFTGDVTVPNNVTFTLEKGIVIKPVNSSISIIVEGNLQAIGGGVQTSPIVITSLKDDSVSGDTNNDGNTTYPAPADWGRIYFKGTGSNGSVLQYCILKYGGTGNYGMVEIDGNSNSVATSPTINNSTIRDSYSMGIYIYTNNDTYLVNPTISNNRIVNNTGYHLQVLKSYNTASSQSITAENNWWGSAIPDTQKFFGTVDYDPYLSSDPYAPSSPAGFTGTAISTTSINWIWTDIATDETAYYLQDNSSNNIVALSPNTTFYTETNLNANTMYKRHVTAVNLLESSYSDTINIYTLANVPTSLVAISTGSAMVNLTWSGDGSRYAIERATDTNGIAGTWNYITQWQEGLVNKTYTEYTLAPATTYWYRVSAYNGNQRQTNSSTPVTIKTAPPSATNFTGIAGSTYSIKWTWADISNTENGYRLENSTHGSLSGKLPANTTFYEETGLLANTQYTRHLNVWEGNSHSDTNPVTVYTLSLPPSGITALNVTKTSMQLQWTGYGTKYIVDRSSDGINWWEVKVSTDNYYSTSLYISNLTRGLNWFRVKSVNYEGIINPDGISLAVETLPGTPPTPTDSGMYVNTSTFTFTWPVVTNAISYLIQVGTSPGANNFYDGEVGNFNNQLLTGFLDNTTYYARIKVQSPAGYSDWSASSDGILVDLTPPPPPVITSPTHSDQTKSYFANTVNFGWNKPSDLTGITGFYFVFNGSAATNPTVADTFITSTTLTYTDLADGIYYLHLVAKDNAGNFSPVSRLRIEIRTVVQATQNTSIETPTISIDIPAGTVDSNKNIKIQTVPVSTLPQNIITDSQLKGTAIIQNVYFTDGTKSLNHEVTLTLKYTDSDVAGLDETNLKLFYYDEQNSTWRLIANATVYPDENKIVGRVNHLTLFRVMEFAAPTEKIYGVSNYPNPFSPLKADRTKLRFYLKEDGEVQFKIFDLIGDLVYQTSLNLSSGGPYEIVWDGKNETGIYVTNGVYITQLSSGGTKIIRRIGVK